MIRTTTTIFALSCMLLASPARAAGDDGRFVIRGAGLLTCANFVEEREKQSDAYYMIGGWIDGYITGINHYKADTYDITSYESTELLARVIDKHCSSNPDDRLYTVLNTLVARIEQHRIENASAPVAVEVGNRSTRLYVSTLRRIQERLLEKGYYDGEVTGRYDDSVAAAMRLFQEEIGFAPSGYPDQASLWFLLNTPDPG